MQIQIVNGIFTDRDGDFRTSYPENYYVVPKENGVSKGYLRPAEGISLFATGPGPDRGGIEWNGELYRVMGTKLVHVSSAGVITVLGEVGGGFDDLVTLDFSSDTLAIASGGDLYYYDGTSVQKVTDPDIGVVLDVRFVDGRFMTTDGENLIVTELLDKFAVDPNKYGSSEIDPDPVMGLLKLKNEIHAINRNTIESFQQITNAGDLFPFARIDGAQIMRGAIGTHTACIFNEAIAFVGGGRNEPPAVWIGANSQTGKISTREIDQILLEYSDDELSNCLLEPRIYQGHEFLYFHLPDKTLIFDSAASRVIQEPIWSIVHSGIETPSQYRARAFVWCYDRWITGDPTSNTLGVMRDDISSHFSQNIGWEFNTPIIYNESVGAIVHNLELVSLPGRVALGYDPVVFTSYSLDGMNFSQEKTARTGKIGDRLKRIAWFYQGAFQNWRIQKFRGSSDAHLPIARLEAKIEALTV